MGVFQLKALQFFSLYIDLIFTMFSNNGCNFAQWQVGFWFGFLRQLQRIVWEIAFTMQNIEKLPTEYVYHIMELMEIRVEFN